MTENAKTGLFAAAAALVGLLAWVSMPKQASTIDEVEAIVGKPLFEKFTDPTEVAKLRIVKFDDVIGSIDKFELARDAKTGAWIIPSHDSYPADAAAQVSKVANAFVNLRALTVAAKQASDHKDFGVTEPDETKEQVGETGIGTFVSMENQKGETLVNLVIGKSVRDNDKQHYVRRTGSDPVYTAEIDPSILSTDFSTWIEGDLLKLSSTDVSQLAIRDYNIIAAANGRNALKKNFDAIIDYNGQDGKWATKSIEVYEGKSAKNRPLTDAEELNSTKLNEIRNTLDNLRIVDVARKPKGLAADLKADNDLLNDNDKIMSLANRGFMPGEGPDGKLEIFSKNGELAVKLKDGIEYLLRFGETIGSFNSGDSPESGSSVSLNRTLFVTARLDESVYPQPELRTVPDTVEQMLEIEAKEKAQAEAEAAAEAASQAPLPTLPTESPSAPPAELAPATPSATPTNTVPASEPPTLEPPVPESPAPTSPSAESKPTTSEPESTPTEPTESTEKSDATPPEASSPSTTPDPSRDSAQSLKPTKTKIRLVSTQSDGQPSSSETPTTSKSSESKASAGDSNAQATTEAPAKPADEPKKETEQELKERLEAMRERLTKENTRMLDERKDRLEAARKKAAELNARFADWYYTISDAEYKRLRVSLDDLITKKSTPADPGLPPSN